jgi:serine/threonine protein kinase
MESQIPSAKSQPPQINDIEVLEVIGEGGMSLVYKARQNSVDRIVALKVLSNTLVHGDDALKRFQLEAKLTSALNHPNIVKTLSFGISNDQRAYLVMEFLQGSTLSDELKSQGRMQLSRFRDIFVPVLSAIAAAHEASLVHRDIKPGNIMSCRDQSGSETIKLLDFGLAKIVSDDGNPLEPSMTRTGVLIGSPAYMSPEQCTGKPLDARSDIYSLACVMYEALLGEPPFSANTALELMKMHSMDAPPSVQNLSKKFEIDNELLKLVLAGLEKDPANRPQSASDLASKLSRVLDTLTLERVPQLKSGPKQSAVGKSFVIGLGTIVVLAFVVALFLYKQGQRNADRKQITLPTNMTANERTERAYKKALLQSEKIYGADSAEVAAQITKLAEFYQANMRHKEAEPLFRRGLAIEQRITTDPIELSNWNYAVGMNLRLQHKCREAEPFCKRVMELRKQVTDKDDVKMAYDEMDLAEVYQEEGRLEEAEAMARLAKETLTKGQNKRPQILKQLVGKSTYAPLMEEHSGDDLRLRIDKFYQIEADKKKS